MDGGVSGSTRIVSQYLRFPGHTPCPARCNPYSSRRQDGRCANVRSAIRVMRPDAAKYRAVASQVDKVVGKIRYEAMEIQFRSDGGCRLTRADPREESPPQMVAVIFQGQRRMLRPGRSAAILCPGGLCCIQIRRQSVGAPAARSLRFSSQHGDRPIHRHGVRHGSLDGLVSISPPPRRLGGTVCIGTALRTVAMGPHIRVHYSTSAAGSPGASQPRAPTE